MDGTRVYFSCSDGRHGEMVRGADGVFRMPGDDDDVSPCVVVEPKDPSGSGGAFMRECGLYSGFVPAVEGE